MIYLEQLNSLNVATFNRLFDECIDAMNAGSYPFHLFPELVTNEQKRQHILESFTNTLAVDNTILWQVREDDRVLMYNVGHIEGTLLRWVLSVIGTNSAGSKSYFYSDDYFGPANEFYSSLGIETISIETTGKGGVQDHLIKVVGVFDSHDNLANTHIEIPGAGAIDEIDFSTFSKFNANLKITTPSAIDAAANTDTANTVIPNDPPMPYEQYANNTPIFNPPPEE